MNYPHPSGRRWSDIGDAEQRQMVDEYLSGTSAVQIAKAHNIGFAFMYDKLFPKFLPNGRVRDDRIILPLDTIRKIGEDYAAGAHSTTLMDRYNISRGAVFNALHRQRVQPRTNGEAHRQYTLNHHAFDIPGEHTSYWSGFALADGYVTGNCVGMTLGIVDIEHVQAFARFLGTDSPIEMLPAKTTTIKSGVPQTINSGPAARLIVTSSHLVAALGRYGVVPRKSKIAHLIGLEDDCDAWRGVIDGDGCITFSRGRGYPHLRLCGSLPLMQQFVDFAARRLGGHKVTIHPHRNIHCVLTSCTFAIELIRLLYGNATIYLPRKMKRARAAMDYKLQRRPGRNSYHPHPTLWPKA